VNRTANTGSLLSCFPAAWPARLDATFDLSQPSETTVEFPNHDCRQPHFARLRRSHHWRHQAVHRFRACGDLFCFWGFSWVLQLFALKRKPGDASFSQTLGGR